MPPATPASAAPLASNGVLALLATLPTPRPASPTECPACLAVPSTAFRADPTRPAPLPFDRGLEVRDLLALVLVVTLAVACVGGLRLPAALPFVVLPRPLDGRVFVSAIC